MQFPNFTVPLPMSQIQTHRHRHRHRDTGTQTHRHSGPVPMLLALQMLLYEPPCRDTFDTLDIMRWLSTQSVGVANEAVDHSPVVPVRKAWRDRLVTLGARFIPRCRGCRRVWCVGSKINGPVPRQQSESDAVYHVCSSKAHAPWSRWLLLRNLRKPLDRYVRDRRRVVTISTTCPVSARKCFRPTRRRIAQDATSFLRI